MRTLFLSLVRRCENILGEYFSRSSAQQIILRLLPTFFLYTDYRYWKIRYDLWRNQDKLYPRTKDEVLAQSVELQATWRFEKEKKLIEHALTLFPNWQYAKDRMAWHERPAFHRDPQKSKRQPRKGILSHMPLPKGIKKLCIVTGSSSNAPYFELTVELLESIKATRYKKVPIKILDCGLTEYDRKFLEQKFNAEVKDPGWDVPENWVQFPTSNKNGMKGAISRPYIHKHFPGYEYYIWADADTWVQHEDGLTQLLLACEQHGVAAIDDGQLVKNHYFRKILTPEYLDDIVNHNVIYSGLFGAHKSFLEKFRTFSEDYAQHIQEYKWGFDTIILTYVIHAFYPELPLLRQNEFRSNGYALSIDGNKNFINQRFITPTGVLKYSPHTMMFSAEGASDKFKTLFLSIGIGSIENPELQEEIRHQYHVRYQYQLGSLFYRL